MAFGIVMLAGTSDVRAQALYGDAFYFMKRQLLWLAIAVVAGLAVSRLDYHIWQKLAVPVFIFSAIILTIVLIPGFGVKVGGSRRWLRLGFASIQPSEIGKFGMILFLAWWMHKERRRVLEFKKGFLYPFILTCVLLLLILLEPDFGTTILCGAVAMALLATGGARLFYVLSTGLIGVAGLVVLLLNNPVRARRIMAFLNPTEYADSEGYHLISSINALTQGGIGGVGLGKSMQKHFYLPEAHTDFIFAIIGEELGLIATLMVVLFFTAFFICGLIVSLKAYDKFGRMLAYGITLMISLQAVINIGVVTGCLPTKGLPLPFISFGGSSLVMSMVSVGVLANIAQHTGGNIGDSHTKAVKDRVHRF